MFQSQSAIKSGQVLLHFGPLAKLLDFRRGGVANGIGTASNQQMLRWTLSMSIRFVFSTFGLHWLSLSSNVCKSFGFILGRVHHALFAAGGMNPCSRRLAFYTVL